MNIFVALTIVVLVFIILFQFLTLRRLKRPKIEVKINLTSIEENTSFPKYEKTKWREGKSEIKKDQNKAKPKRKRPGRPKKNTK